jgi:DNA-binding response OmpR family regulator
MKSISILLVEDDKVVSTLLKKKLESKGYIVYPVYRGDSVRKNVIRHAPDCVVLDVGLPDIDGYQVCQQLREFYDGPIMFLTGHGSSADELKGLTVGADDFVSKDKDFEVFHLRLNKLLSSQGAKKTLGHYQIDLGCLTFDKKQFRCEVADQAVPLTSEEAELLYFLLVNKDRLVTRDELYMTLKGCEYDGVSRSMDISISRLKAKLAVGPVTKQLISSVRFKGYIFNSQHLCEARIA